MAKTASEKASSRDVDMMLAGWRGGAGDDIGAEDRPEGGRLDRAVGHRDPSPTVLCVNWADRRLRS